MSSTFSSCSRESSEKGSAPVTRRSTSSTSHSSSAHIETRCWASTSSGLRGITVSSISPSRIRRATTAHSSRSARNLGKIRPSETSPSVWPARPIRCRPRVTDFGDSTWITRSTAPMSIPSSSEEVATRQGSWPDFSSSSTTSALLVRERAVVGPGDLDAVRRLAAVLAAAGRASCARRARSPAAPARLLVVRQLVQALGEPLGAAAVVDEDDRRGVLPDQLRAAPGRSPARSSAWSAGVEVRVGPVRLRSPAVPGRFSGARRRLGSVMSSTGTTISRSSSFGLPASTISHLRLGPTRNSRDPLERALGRREPDPLDVGIVARRRGVDADARAAPGSAPGGRRASTARPRGSRRRSPPRRRSGSPARPRSSSGRATRGS